MEAGEGSAALLVAALPGATGAGAAKVTTGAGPATEGRMDSQALKEASATRVTVKRGRDSRNLDSPDLYHRYSAEKK